MELRQLEHFVAMAEDGHFTCAANRCHIGQSALSTSIRSLERELGSPLFLRTTRKVELTEAGRVLLEEARRTLAAATSARESVLAVVGLLRSTLRVGGIPTPGLLDQAALLASFRALHPGVDIRYVRDTSMALVPEVEASRLDVAFVSLPRRLPEAVMAVPLDTHVDVRVPTRPPLAGRPRVALKSLVAEDFVGPPEGSTGYEAADRVFAATGQERRVPSRSTSLDHSGVRRPRAGRDSRSGVSGNQQAGSSSHPARRLVHGMDFRRHYEPRPSHADGERLYLPSHGSSSVPPRRDAAGTLWCGWRACHVSR